MTASHSDTEFAPSTGPLAGLKVVELGQLIAGPFAAKTLGEFGAEAMLTISPRPEDICIIVAGGPGTHSTYAPSFGMIRAVTRVVG